MLKSPFFDGCFQVLSNENTIDSNRFAYTENRKKEQRNKEVLHFDPVIICTRYYLYTRQKGRLNEVVEYEFSIEKTLRLKQGYKAKHNRLRSIIIGGGALKLGGRSALDLWWKLL